MKIIIDIKNPNPKRETATAQWQVNESDKQRIEGILKRTNRKFPEFFAEIVNYWKSNLDNLKLLNPKPKLLRTIFEEDKVKTNEVIADTGIPFYELFNMTLNGIETQLGEEDVLD